MTTISPHITRGTGTILTAAIYNTDHQNHVLNAQALNADKLEFIGGTVVDGDTVVWNGTGGTDVRSGGAPPGGFRGTGVLNFGAFPGVPEATLVVAGQLTIAAGSVVQAWIRPVATADHSEDEHTLEEIEVTPFAIVAGTGFTIRGTQRPHVEEVDPILPAQRGLGPRIYGQFNVAWRWS